MSVIKDSTSGLSKRGSNQKTGRGAVVDAMLNGHDVGIERIKLSAYDEHIGIVPNGCPDDHSNGDAGEGDLQLAGDSGSEHAEPREFESEHSAEGAARGAHP